MPLNAGSAYIDIFANLKPIVGQLHSQLPAQARAAGAKAGADLQAGMKGAIQRAKASFGGGDLFGPKGFLGAALIGGAIAGLKRLADQTADYADEVDDLGDITGATAEDASRLVAILKAAGLEASSVGRPILTLSESLRKGGGALKEYFSEAELARLRTNDLAAAIPVLAQRYNELEDPIDRNGLAVAAFGKRGAALIDVLERSGDELDEWVKHAEEAGLIFSAEQVEEARRYQVALREFDQTLKGLGQTAGNAAIPLFTDVAEGLNALILSGRQAGGYLQRALKPIGDFMEKYGTLHVDEKSPQWLQDLLPNAMKADEAVSKLDTSLDHLKLTAAGDEEAMKLLRDTFKSAFADAEKAAAEFESRLDSLIPKIGEEFDKPEFGIFDRMKRDAADIRSALDAVADAEDSLADARSKVVDEQRYLVKTPEREEALADARRSVAKATRALSEAQDDLVKARKGEKIKGFASILEDDTKRLNVFTDSLEKIKTRLGKGGLDQFEEAFLAGLVELGPGAAGLLSDVVKLSDKELANLSDVFSDQIKAAKRAADIEFDKFPDNFSAEIRAARHAAVKELDVLVGKFQALPNQADPSGMWGEMLDAQARKIQSLADDGTIQLTRVERGFLDAALGADDASTAVGDLQKVIDSLEGKKVKVGVDIEMNAVIGGKVAPNEYLHKLFTGEMDSADRPRRHVRGRGRGSSHSGGPVRAGEEYHVLENEIFTPNQDGWVFPRNSGKAAPTSVSKTTQYNLNGPIHFPSARELEEHLDRKTRLETLSGGAPA